MDFLNWLPHSLPSSEMVPMWCSLTLLCSTGTCKRILFFPGSEALRRVQEACGEAAYLEKEGALEVVTPERVTSLGK